MQAKASRQNNEKCAESHTRSAVLLARLTDSGDLGKDF